MTPSLIVLGLLCCGALLGWVLAARVARRREAELRDAAAALDASRGDVGRLMAACMSVSDGLIVLDEQGHLVAANDAAVDLAHMATNDLRGARLEDLVPWTQLHEALRECRRDGMRREFELDEELAFGRSLEVELQPLPDFGYAIHLHDQSRVRQLESLRRDFVANVSHELKTPLAAIKGYVETIQDDPEMPDEVRRRFLDRIAVQTGRLTTLVADLLTLSRLDEESDVPVRASPADFASVLRETVRDLAPLAERRSLELVSSLPEGALWVRADREAMRQIAGNLIDNALKYTPEGGTVTVRLAGNGRKARLDVVDTGIGLSPADQERVFERFYRVDRARSRDLGGTGLGLSIVKNTARNLGGQVGVQSRLGTGSTFWIELPLCS
ncbi:MAG: PAS domain-containing protein [Planctomycetes bacterium]|nr:PAS domain-containing protein [Planctomycetota bacterium]